MSVSLPTSRDKDDWQLWLWNQPEDVLSRTQRLEFMMMLEASFNSFDAFRVVGDLMTHRRLWDGVVMDRGYVRADARPNGLVRLWSDLIKLRDIEEGHWNVDTLFVLTTANHEAELKRIAADWVVDCVNAVDDEHVGFILGCMPPPEGTKILTFWWD